MEEYIKENYGEVKPKNSSEEALQRWRKLCWLVKNPKRRFRFTANLSKRFEARAIQRSNQVNNLFLRLHQKKWDLSVQLLVTLVDFFVSCFGSQFCPGKEIYCTKIFSRNGDIFSP